MTHSESIANLAAALSAAQGELAPVAFDRDNPFYHSRYATLTALREAMRPVFARHGLAVVQGLGANGGITTTILHASGEWIALDGPAMCPVKADPQGIGSAMTYARRYGLAAAAGLVADEDDDAEGAIHGKAPQSPQDASTPRSDVRHPEPQKQVNAEVSCVNAGASPRHGEACTITGTINGDVYPGARKGRDGTEYSIATFDLYVGTTDTGGIVYHVTAWHEAAAQAEAFADGACVEVHGKWNEYKGAMGINANKILDGIPF